jgi:hypothetical protein
VVGESPSASATKTVPPSSSMNCPTVCMRGVLR